jgi:hypothetical protein
MGIGNWIIGTSALAQLIQTVLMLFIAYSVMMLLAGVLDVVNTYSQSSLLLLPYLYDNSQTITIAQNPNARDAITIYPSINAPTGLEFSYSCWLNINKATFGAGTNALKHIFHKGTPTFRPLMCPGVFVRANDNALVIYLNETLAWNTYCEIPNIPVGKFFHLAIIVRNMTVDVFINGNVTHRMQLRSVPRQNFGDLIVFSTESCNDSTANPNDPLIVAGAAQGLISRLYYTGYALNYEQIDKMIRDGPSTNMVSSTNSLPPYMADNWWIGYYRP